MNGFKNQVTGIKIAYIGGGSTIWGRQLMSDLALYPDMAGIVKLYDLDYQAAYDNQIIGNKLLERFDVKGKWIYEAVHTLEEALLDANFVIISILPGTFNEMKSDVHCPEKYGIYQSVGDTVGPGGLMRALRTIPIFVEFAQQIKKHAPEAWVLNHTNPLTLCIRTLYEVFPEIKAFGCCNEVFKTRRLMITMLESLKSINGITTNEIYTNVLGINHFTWIDQASYKGMNLIPIYQQFVDQYYESGFVEPGEKNWLNDTFKDANRVKFDLFRNYGLIAAASDRHLAEFLPPWYLKNPEIVSTWKFRLTTVNWRVEDKKDSMDKSRRLVNGDEELKLVPSDGDGILMIRALLGLGDLITNVNLPNQGQMNDFPFGPVVETNAVFSNNCVRPIVTGKVPLDLQSLIMRHILNQETLLKASLTKDKEMAFHAFINDPLVTLDMVQARELFNEMLLNMKCYLHGWNL
jgi:galacturan 1,4-alpha-galacturonidase